MDKKHNNEKEDKKDYLTFKIQFLGVDGNEKFEIAKTYINNNHNKEYFDTVGLSFVPITLENEKKVYLDFIIILMKIVLRMVIQVHFINIME